MQLSPLDDYNNRPRWSHSPSITLSTILHHDPFEDTKYLRITSWSRSGLTRRKKEFFINLGSCPETKHSPFKTGAIEKGEIVEENTTVFDKTQTIRFFIEKTLSSEGLMSEKDKLLDMQIKEAEARGLSMKRENPCLYTRTATSSSMQSRNADMLSISPC
ncbi:hypothetical protein M422DRAFT_247411 [Sphaerobolus stellatus SS14]|nr:hypothetical protein M422DRAFT_247411 [Sphaerobolus stellatus SS14]